MSSAFNSPKITVICRLTTNATTTTNLTIPVKKDEPLKKLYGDYHRRQNTKFGNPVPPKRFNLFWKDNRVKLTDTAAVLGIGDGAVITVREILPTPSAPGLSTPPPSAHSSSSAAGLSVALAQKQKKQQVPASPPAPATAPPPTSTSALLPPRREAVPVFIPGLSMAAQPQPKSQQLQQEAPALSASAFSSSASSSTSSSFSGSSLSSASSYSSSPAGPTSQQHQPKQQEQQHQPKQQQHAPVLFASAASSYPPNGPPPTSQGRAHLALFAQLASSTDHQGRWRFLLSGMEWQYDCVFCQLATYCCDCEMEGVVMDSDPGPW